MDVIVGGGDSLFENREASLAKMPRKADHFFTFNLIEIPTHLSVYQRR